VRPCIYQYRCIGNIFLNEPVACVANAATAHGDTDLPQASRPRRFLVVGGGPAGVEAARLLASRGHTVVLAESAPRLGGTLVPAGHTDPVLARFVDWMVAEIERCAVDLRLSTYVTPQLVDELDLDEVVIATGGIWTTPQVETDARSPVRTVPELTSWLATDDGSLPPDVVVLGGDKAGLSIAELCVRRGHRVTVLEAGAVPAARLGPPGRFRLVHEVQQLGVSLERHAELVELLPDAVVWRDREGTDHRTPAGAVVTTTSAPDLGAVARIAGTNRPVHVIGDARDAGGVEGAMTDARTLALGAD